MFRTTHPAGRTLFYTSGGKLYGLNCSTLLEQARRPSSAGVAPRAAHLALPAPALLLAPAAAACASPASESQQLGGCRLLVLSRSGTLLDVRCPTGGALDATAAAQEEGRGLQDLEGEMQASRGFIGWCTGLVVGGRERGLFNNQAGHRVAGYA